MVECAEASLPHRALLANTLASKFGCRKGSNWDPVRLPTTDSAIVAVAGGHGVLRLVSRSSCSFGF